MALYELDAPSQMQLSRWLCSVASLRAAAKKRQPKPEPQEEQTDGQPE